MERARLNKVEFVPSSLHGYKLLRLEPKVTAALVRFLDTTLKSRPAEWEPQYNLTPVTFGDPQLVQNLKPADNAKNKAKNQAKDQRQERRSTCGTPQGPGCPETKTRKSGPETAA